MKAGTATEKTEPEDYEEADLRRYQRLIGKLMYWPAEQDQILLS